MREPAPYKRVTMGLIPTAQTTFRSGLAQWPCARLLTGNETGSIPVPSANSRITTMNVGGVMTQA